jgi:hypothetical protein
LKTRTKRDGSSVRPRVCPVAAFAFRLSLHRLALDDA